MLGRGTTLSSRVQGLRAQVRRAGAEALLRAPGCLSLGGEGLFWVCLSRRRYLPPHPVSLPASRLLFLSSPRCRPCPWRGAVCAHDGSSPEPHPAPPMLALVLLFDFLKSGSFLLSGHMPAQRGTGEGFGMLRASRWCRSRRKEVLHSRGQMPSRLVSGRDHRPQPRQDPRSRGP